MNISDALEIVQEFQSAFNVLFPNEESLDIFSNLLNLYKPKGIKIYDFEHISIALANNISKIASFNVKDFNSIKEIDLIDISKI